MLVNVRDLEIDTFNHDGKPLRIELHDIYFLTRLSHRGKLMNLKSQWSQGGMNIEDYIATHCVAGK